MDQFNILIEAIYRSQGIKIEKPPAKKPKAAKSEELPRLTDIINDFGLRPGVILEK